MRPVLIRSLQHRDAVGIGGLVDNAEAEHPASDYDTVIPLIIGIRPWWP